MHFVLLTAPRCGTHLVRGMLDQHPEIHCASEVFNPDAVGPGKYCVKSQVKEHVLRKDRICGSILHATSGDPEHCQPAVQKWEHLWGELPRYVQKVIYLQRRDLFARYVSVQVALKRNKWQIRKGQSVKPVPPFEVDPEHAAKEILRVCDLMSRAKTHFEDRPTYWIYYEDLCQDMPWGMSQLYSFLGVKHFVPTPTMKKVGIAVRKQVSNYDEVKETLKYYDFQRRMV